MNYTASDYQWFICSPKALDRCVMNATSTFDPCMNFKCFPCDSQRPRCDITKTCCLIADQFKNKKDNDHLTEVGSPSNDVSTNDVRLSCYTIPKGKLEIFCIFCLYAGFGKIRYFLNYNLRLKLRINMIFMKS